MTSKCRHITFKCRLMTSFFQNLIPKLLLLFLVFWWIFLVVCLLCSPRKSLPPAVFSFPFAQLQLFSSQIRVKVFSIAVICNQLVQIHHLMYRFPCECNTCSFLYLWKHCIAITCWMIPLHCKLVVMSWSSDRMVKKMVDVFSWVWEIILEFRVITDKKNGVSC